MKKQNTIDCDMELVSRAHTVLEDPESSKFQIIKSVQILEHTAYAKNVKVGVSSNIVTDSLGVFLKKYGFISGVNVDVVVGNYDDIAGDMGAFAAQNLDYVVVMPFFDNLLPSFETQCLMMPADILNAKKEEFRHLCRLAFQKVKFFKQVFVTNCHQSGVYSQVLGQGDVASIIDQFNHILHEEIAKHGNVTLIDAAAIVSENGRKNCIDSRFYYLNKAPYTDSFLDVIALTITNVTKGYESYFKKVLVVDCDNTIWGGIVGEDLIGGIQLNPFDYPGNIFWKIQHDIMYLHSKGVLVCLASKNNLADVDEVLADHPHVLLKESALISKKVNWIDKADNIRVLAEELNLGLDSFIFLDDSDFECESVKQQLPMVETFQVPKDISKYPDLMVKIKQIFDVGEGNDGNQTAKYRLRAQALELENSSLTRTDYLKSLNLKVRIYSDSISDIVRISELSQKTNQFNLTGRRYSISEIEARMLDDDFIVYSIDVSDRFGSSGLTGILVARVSKQVIFIENFCMSCRILGRGIENIVWSAVVGDAHKYGVTSIIGEYIASSKNSQVASLYADLGFNQIEDFNENKQQYEIFLEDLLEPTNEWITYERIR